MPTIHAATTLSRSQRRAADSADFDSFYAAQFDRVVVIAFGMTADPVEAQDVAQEAFCRAWERWNDISRYDNPAAWVCRVAANISVSRWRRLKVGRANLWRHRPDNVPPASPDHVAVIAALRTLPVDQRRAMLLHYYADLGIKDIAEELGVPAGTVKSWLHRSRNELASMLTDRVAEGQELQPAAVRRKADRRRTRRAAIVAAVSVVAFALVLLGVQVIDRRGSSLPPTVPSPSPTRPITSQVDPTDPIRRVDWANATIDVPPGNPGNCISGRLAFQPQGPLAVTSLSTGSPRMVFDVERVALGDLDGDGLAEAAVNARCDTDGPDGQSPSRLLIVKRTAAGELTSLLWWISPRQSAVMRTFWIGDDLLHVDERPWDNAAWRYEIGQVDGYRLDAGGFRQLVPMRFSPVSRRMLGDSVVPIKSRIRCAGADPYSESTEWQIADGPLAASGVHLEIYVELGRSGEPYLLLPIMCNGPGVATVFNPSLVLFDRVDGRWRAVDVIGTVPDHTFQTVQITGDRLLVTYVSRGSGPAVVRGYRWNGAELVES